MAQTEFEKQIAMVIQLCLMPVMTHMHSSRVLYERVTTLISLAKEMRELLFRH